MLLQAEVQDGGDLLILEEFSQGPEYYSVLFSIVTILGDRVKLVRQVTLKI